MTRGPAMRPLSVASIPKCSSVCNEQRSDPIRGRRVGLRVRRRPVQDGAIRQDVLGVLRDVGDVEERRRILVERLRLDEQRLLFLLGADHVRKRVHCVERRRRRSDLRLLCRRRRSRSPPACCGAHGVMRAAHDRARRRAGEQQRADDQREDSEDRRAGTEQRAKPTAEDPAEEAAVRGAEGRQQAERENGETDAKRAEVHELAARDHERADADESERDEVGGRSDEAVDGIGQRAADNAAVPAAVEDDPEEEPGRDEPEAVELRVPSVRPLPSSCAS